MTAEHGKIPDWAARDRQRDLAWIRENLFIFWPVATDAYVALGRGAIVVDTTQQPLAGLGHPFGYFTQADIEARDDQDLKRIVREYDPDWEFVLAMLKPKDLMSIYRMQPQPRR